MNKKYEFTNEIKEVDGVVLHRIKAIRDFGDVNAGDLGGFIEKESNLSHDDYCWVYDNACVYDVACIFGCASVSGSARVYGCASVSGDARVYGDARVHGNACIFDNAWVHGDASVCDFARVYGDTCVYGNACIYGYACVYGDASVCGDTYISNNAIIESNFDYCTFNGFGAAASTTTAFRCSDGVIRINCWCSNTLEEFRKQIKETCDGKYAKEYLLIADVIEEHFKED